MHFWELKGLVMSSKFQLMVVSTTLTLYILTSVCAILLTVLCNSYGTDKENLFNNQELRKLVIILFILMTWTCNSEVIL